MLPICSVNVGQKRKLALPTISLESQKTNDPSLVQEQATGPTSPVSHKRQEQTLQKELVIRRFLSYLKREATRTRRIRPRRELKVGS